MFPFGCAIKIHIPLDLQTTSTGRSADGIHVGEAASHKWGVQIYNPLTNRSVIRSDFKVMGPEPYVSPLLRVPVLWEAVDEEVADNPRVYGADMGSSESISSVVSGPVVEPSAPLTEPFADKGIDASRDLSTGESVLFDNSEIITHLNLDPSVDNQLPHSSLLTDEINVPITDDDVLTALDILPVPTFETASNPAATKPEGAGAVTFTPPSSSP
jgi:hypothetical protein